MKYVFEVRDGDKLIATYPVDAPSGDVAWEWYGMGLADYPPSMTVTLRPASPEPAP